MIVENMFNGVDISKLGPVRGMVVDVKDPLKLCRIRVRIPSIHGCVGSANYRPDEELNWAYPSLPANVKQVPKVGDFVWVLFENNRVDMPIYIGVVLGKGSATPSKPIVFGSGVKLVPGNYEAPYSGQKAGTIFESPKGFSINYDDGTREDGTDGKLNIEKDNMKVIVGTDIAKIIVGESSVNVTPNKITITNQSSGIEMSGSSIAITNQNSRIETNGSSIALTIGGSAIRLTSSGIVLSIGGTSVTLDSNSLRLVSSIIYEN